MATLDMTLRIKWWVYPLLAVLPIVLIPLSRVVDVTGFVDRTMRFISSRGIVYDDA